MAAHDGSLAQRDGVIEALLAGVAEVHHHAITVHLCNDMGSEIAHASMFTIATG